MWNRGNISGKLDKIMSHVDSTFSDHGIFRVFWKSWGMLPGQMYRSNQPYPYQIKRDIKNYNIKSIINLRGERHCSSYYLEKNICTLENIKIYNFPISSRDIPDKSKLIEGMKFHKNYRDMSFLFILGTYMLNILDANVSSHLMQFNVKDNLSVKPQLNSDFLGSQTNVGLKVLVKI